MDDPALVRRVERVDDLPRDRERIPYPQSRIATAKTIGERPALDELHDDKRLRRRFQPIDLRDVRMVQ